MNSNCMKPPIDVDDPFSETEEQAARRKFVEAKVAEFTAKLCELQEKKERRRTNAAIAKVLLGIRERAQSIPTHPAKGAIEDFVAIVDEELAKVSSSE